MTEERTVKTPDIPDGLWAMPLFAGPAVFPAPGTGIAVEKIELALRRLRNMPVSTAQAEQEIGGGLNRVLGMTRKWLCACGKDGAHRADILTRIDRMKGKLAIAPSPSMRASVLMSIRGFLPEKFHAVVPAAENYAEWGLELLMFCFVEDYLKTREPALYRRFLGRVFRVIDSALEYNPTTDVRRVFPLLQWIRFMLMAERRADYAFCDVGCALAAGAPALVHAASVLRPQGLCRAVHGTDIAAPAAQLRREMLKSHGICVYRSEFVHRPLPRRYDAILLANVHRLLDRDSQKLLLENLWHSMSDMGFLFVNWRFGPQLNPCLCLRKWKTGFYIDKQNNLP